MNIYGKTSHSLLLYNPLTCLFFFFNRNLAWNKIAVIHPNAFSTLPSLRKLWVFHDLFMACLLIIGPHLINQKCWFCWKSQSAQNAQPSVSPALELDHTRKEHPTSHPPPLQGHVRPYVDKWRSGWQLVLVIEVKFSIFAEPSGGMD